MRTFSLTSCGSLLKGMLVNSIGAGTCISGRISKESFVQRSESLKNVFLENSSFLRLRFYHVTSSKHIPVGHALLTSWNHK